MTILFPTILDGRLYIPYSRFYRTTSGGIEAEQAEIRPAIETANQEKETENERTEN